MKSAEEFTSAIKRWFVASLYVILYVACVHAWVLWSEIRDDQELFDALLQSCNQKTVFVKTFRHKLEDADCSKSLLQSSCSQGHGFAAMAENIAATMFNGMATNLMREYNSNIHAGKKRTTSKATSAGRKIQKLTSWGHTTMKRVTLINNKQTNKTTNKQNKQNK